MVYEGLVAVVNVLYQQDFFVKSQNKGKYWSQSTGPLCDPEGVFKLIMESEL